MNKFATIEEIHHAHKVLLKDKPFFEKDKTDIIECDETKDIKACPGSGKTTTLLAKLIILANRMPLDNNQGICVLTHTNVAIDEIKSKLGNKADILFKYPNHFGTIQSFVDKFLAIPSLKRYYSCGSRRIDNDVANNALLLEFKKLNQYTNTLHTFLYNRFYSSFSEVREPEINEWIERSGNQTIKDILLELSIIKKRGTKYYLDLKNSSWTKLKQLTTDTTIRSFVFEKRRVVNDLIEKEKIDFIQSLNIDFVGNKVYSDSLQISSNSESGHIFSTMKENCFKKGLLSFQDAYNLSFKYINDHNKQLKNAFSSRFKYLFIDEMQDTDEKQYQLIKQIFDEQHTIVQKFGDHHQSIYNKVSDTEIWSPNSPLEINGSKRFGENIAKILRTVCIENNSSLKANENIQSLQPIMIVFDDPKDVLPKYTELLLSRHVDGKSIWELANTIRSRDPQNRQNIKAIGWVGKVENEFNIKSYFTDFNSQLKKDKVNYDSLKSFLCKQEKNTLKIYSDKIIEALLHLLSIANLRIDNRTYTKTSLEVDFARRSPEKYILFREQTAIWAKEIHSSESYNNETIIQIRNYLKSEFCPLFGIDPSNTYVVNFIDNETSTVATQAELENQNIFKKDDVEVEVATVHSVKGETHIATLYMETSYHGEHEGARIIDQIIGKTYTPPKRVKDTHRKESLKMAYVGMSRPIYLLCFAIHADRFNAKESELRKCGLWEIVYTKEDNNQL